MEAAKFASSQAPIREKFARDAKAALLTLKATGTADASTITCKVDTGRGLAVAGLVQMQPAIIADGHEPAGCGEAAPVPGLGDPLVDGADGPGARSKDQGANEQLPGLGHATDTT